MIFWKIIVEIWSTCNSKESIKFVETLRTTFFLPFWEALVQTISSFQAVLKAKCQTPISRARLEAASTICCEL